MNSTKTVTVTLSSLALAVALLTGCSAQSPATPATPAPLVCGAGSEAGLIDRVGHASKPDVRVLNPSVLVLRA